MVRWLPLRYVDRAAEPRSYPPIAVILAWRFGLRWVSAGRVVRQISKVLRRASVNGSKSRTARSEKTFPLPSSHRFQENTMAQVINTNVASLNAQRNQIGRASCRERI